MNFRISTVLLLLLSITAVPLFAQEYVFEERDGLVAVEAEHFIEQTKTSKRKWRVISADSIPDVSKDADKPHYRSASGGAYLEILPDTRQTHDDPLVNGTSFSNTPGVLGILTYQVYFNTPGKYYVWVRAYSTGTEDNGIHVGLDGRWPTSGRRMQWCNGKNQWYWESRQRTDAQHCGVPYGIYLQIDEPGLHTVMFSMREDGFEFDKFILTTDRRFSRPSGAGPDEVPFTSQVKPQPSHVPAVATLAQNYPNPFNPETIIRYKLQVQAFAILEIINVYGEVVRNLVSSEHLPGVYSRLWDGKDSDGYTLPSGVYFYRLQALSASSRLVEIRKMVLTR